jgi:hypothetical protein
MKIYTYLDLDLGEYLLFTIAFETGNSQVPIRD